MPSRTPTPHDETRPLKLLREEIGMTQEVAAENADVDRTYYNRLETGRLKASTVNARTVLAKALGVTEELINQFLKLPVAEQRGRVKELAAKSRFSSRKTPSLSVEAAARKTLALVPHDGGGAKKRRGR